MVLIPGSLAYVGYKTDVWYTLRNGWSNLTAQGKYSMRGKRRGDTIVEW